MEQMCRPNHLSELSRMLLKPILDNLGPVAWWIILLEYPITVGVCDVYEESKQAKFIYIALFKTGVVTKQLYKKISITESNPGPSPHEQARGDSGKEKLPKIQEETLRGTKTQTWNPSSKWSKCAGQTICPNSPECCSNQFWTTWARWHGELSC